MTEKYSDERRTFLKAVALLGGAAACLPLAKEAVAAQKRPPAQPEKAEPGYRETEHIRKYYQAAKI